MNTRTYIRTRVGMTLIELLIGIVITGAAISAGYAAFSTLVDQQQRMKRTVDTGSRGASIRRQLTMWISGSSIQIESGLPRNKVDPGTQALRDELRGWTQNPNPFGGPAYISLYVNLDNPRYQRGLIAQFTDMQEQSGIVSDTVIVPIDSNIIGMRVEYLFEPTPFDVSENRTRQWLTAEELGTRSQNFVAVRLSFVSDDRSQLTPLLHIPLTIPLR